MSHKCSFQRKRGDIFECEICHQVHECGSDKCVHLFYNADHTQVCALTGLCYEQRMCETIIDMSRGGIANVGSQAYYHRAKRNQQVKNSTLGSNFTVKLLHHMDFYRAMSDRDKTNLLNKIMQLWKEFISRAKTKGIYIHRKDRRCFVVAIMFGIQAGIACTCGFVVYPHSEIKIPKINKKKTYTQFNVSDVRGGQRLIKKVFDGHRVVNPLKLWVI